MKIEVGSVVRSKAGRDKGDLFIVLAVDGNYVYMANGDLRKVDKPKKKKIKHLQCSQTVSEFIANKLRTAGKVTNSELRKALAQVGGNDNG
ncbi:MAG: KOW domain-containing RNA-binding protein [Firmicutes bacterium]|nr:KOW domain-containing RNA-binding protein [Bacillota bacterium]